MAKAKRKTKATTVKAKKSKKKIAAKPAKRATARPKHKFTVSHHREEDFDHGLRPYSAYRDLGIAPATGGMVPTVATCCGACGTGARNGDGPSAGSPESVGWCW